MVMMATKTRGRRAGRGGGRMRGGYGPVATYSVGWWIAGQLLAAIWRFCAGQVVLRRPGRWDSRWLTWAAPVPEHVELSRDEGVPRSTWARRPGWHRQAVRFGAIALLIGMTYWPTITVVVTVVAIAVVGVRRAIDLRDLAYYHRTCGSFLEWTAGRVGWVDLDPDPREWIELPPYTWEWRPVAPLRAALVLSGAEDVPDGWLRRRWPALAVRLEPAAEPVAEWRWVRVLIGPRQGRHFVVAGVLRRIGRAVVWIGESSRRVRAIPRLVAPDLANADARIVIRYPASYQAHGQDLAEVERVVCDRMPCGPWKFKHNTDDLTIEVYHPTTMPRYVQWDRSIFTKFSQLEIPIGVRAGERFVTVDLKGQTPHINASGKTGRGKTVTFLTIIGGFLFHGGHAIIVDPKRIDFVRPFKRLPNVDLVTVPARFATTLRDVDLEMERRYQIMERYTERADELGLPPMEKNAELYFQPLMFTVDEKSAFTAECLDWWKREGNDGAPGKGPSLTVRWERNIVARGRACCIYAMCAAQQNSIPNVFPDTDIRSNYQYKILAGPADGPSWVVTFPGERKKSLSSDVKGRAIVGFGSDLFEAQLANVDPAEIREAAIHGLQMRDKVNLERAKRLSAVSGLPLWEVSPLPWWVPVPAATGSDVHGPADGMDTGAPAVVDAEPAPAVPLALVKNNSEQLPAPGVDESTGQLDDDEIEDVTGSNGHSIPEPVDGSNARSVPNSAGDQFPGAPDGPETIKGNRSAAEFLGVSFDAFRKARSRAEEAGEPIQGMERDGRFVTFDPVQLAEWWNQRPGSGRKAS